jgi:hypothetical protein
MYLIGFFQLPDDCLPWLPEESIKQQLFSSKSEM